jgi:serine/threonine-protein kinase
LAAALAAGETPSPQMVANATDTGGLSPISAWVCLIVSLALTVASLFGIERVAMLRFVPFARTPEALADRARETIERLGHKPLPYESRGFNQNEPYLFHIQKTDSSAGRWEKLRNERPAAIRFWFRESPTEITPANPANTLLRYADPPFTVPGMVGVWLDPKGRLVRLDAVSPPYEPTTPGSAERAPMDWTRLFEAAGLSIGEFRAVPSEWSPSSFADERRAWEGVYPDAKDIPIRIEASAFAGRPVSFRIIEPWMAPKDGSPLTPELESPLSSSMIELGFLIVILVGGTVLAARNVKFGRSDRRGAFRLGIYLFVVRMLVWILEPHGLTGPSSIDVFIANFAFSLYRFVFVWICYVAIEPYLRRLWPRTLISWTRLLEGRWRDPLVGRDCLLGVMGASAIWLGLVGWPLISQWLGTPEPVGRLLFDVMALKALGGMIPAVSAMLFMHATFVLNFGFSMIVFLVLMRLLTRRTWIAVAIWVPFAVLFTGNGGAEIALFTLLSIVTLTIFFRLGVLGLMVVLGLSGLQVPIPGTLSPSAWYAGPSWLFLAVVVAVAVYGFTVSLGGRRAFKGILAEE